MSRGNYLFFFFLLIALGVILRPTFVQSEEFIQYCKVKSDYSGGFLAVRERPNVQATRLLIFPNGTIFRCEKRLRGITNPQVEWIVVPIYLDGGKTMGGFVKYDANYVETLSLPAYQTLYIDAPDGVIPTTIFSEPGMNFVKCKRLYSNNPELINKNCIKGAPPGGASSMFTFQGSKIMYYDDEVVGYKHYDIFYRVSGSYFEMKNGVTTGDIIPVTDGWINAQFVREKHLGKSSLDEVFETPIDVLDESEPVNVPNKSRKLREIPAPSEGIDDESAHNKSLPRPKSEKYVQFDFETYKEKTFSSWYDRKKREVSFDALTFERILQATGQCLNQDPDTVIPDKDSFNDILRKYWRNKSSKSPSEHNSSLFVIDGLARTLYGEMRSCFKNGIRYPMAITRVIYNRANLIKYKYTTRTRYSFEQVQEMIRPFANYTEQVNQCRQRDGLPILGQHTDISRLQLGLIMTHVMEARFDRKIKRRDKAGKTYWVEKTGRGQFSSWDSDDPNLDQILCPHKDTIWKKAVALAFMVLFDTEEFKRKTEEVRYGHYTSGLTPDWGKTDCEGTPDEIQTCEEDNIGKFKRLQNITIDGQPLDNPMCLMLWDDSIYGYPRD